MDRISLTWVPLESYETRLPVGTKLVKIRSILAEIRADEDRSMESNMDYTTGRGHVIVNYFL